MANLEIYRIVHGHAPLLVVPFQEELQHFFQSAASFVQEVAGCIGENPDIDRADGYLGMHTGTWPPAVVQSLYDHCQFTLATVTSGPLQGLQAIGVGSNQKKKIRSSNLALALTMLYSSRQPTALSHDLQQLKSAVRFMTTPLSSPCVSQMQAPSPPSEYSLSSPPPSPPPAPQLPRHSPVPVDVLQADAVSDAKRWLVDWRRRNPLLSPYESQAIVQIEKEKGLDMHGLQVATFRDDPHGEFQTRLQTVLQHDVWKGNSCGALWLRDWCKWVDPFCLSNAFTSSQVLGRKEQQRRANWLYYFGTPYPSDDASPPPSPPLPPVPSPPMVPSFGQSSLPKVRHAFPCAAAEPCEEPSKAVPMRAVPPSGFCCASPPEVNETQAHGLLVHSVEEAPSEASEEILLHSPVTANHEQWPSASGSTQKVLQTMESEGSAVEWLPRLLGMLPVVEESEADRKKLEFGLRKKPDFDLLSMPTVRSKDSLPLGADNDNYLSTWGADKVRGDVAKARLKANCDRRILDSENLGFSYGREVLGREKFWHEDGVVKAIKYLCDQGLEVFVVTKRSSHKSLFQKAGAEVVIADRHDDQIVLKLSMLCQCPVVSRDNFRIHADDLRLEPELREWCKSIALLQVRWSWIRGDFVPDFDLPRPVLRPNHGVSSGCASDTAIECCHECRTAKPAAEGHWHRRKFYCSSCWAEWGRQRSA